jgi:PAS domain S-box-containing protein
VLEANDSALGILGRSREELVGRAVAETGVLEDPEALAYWGRRLRGQSTLRGLEIPILRGTGERAWVLASVDRDRREGGACARVVFQDITSQKRDQDESLQSKKMEALGRLAGGVAHDFNNLLTAILGHSALALEQPGAGGAAGRHVREIKRAAERAAQLTRQLLAFSRRQTAQRRVLDLNAEITEMADFLRRLIGEDIRLVTSLDPALGAIRADPGQVEQILMNLAANARDAMPQGGLLEVSTENCEFSPHPLRADAPMEAERSVRLTVQDSGHGMTSEALAHLFEPFFTTKEVGKGTGLGLATVYGIVTQNGGRIRIQSEPGRGTQVEVYLPRVEEGAPIPQSAPAEEPAGGGRETILLIEDEPAVRRLAREILWIKGYDVLEAEEGSRALEISRSHPGRIDLVITDLMMPGLSGQEVVRQIQASRPGVRVIYMTGHNASTVLGAEELGAESRILGKPFTPTVLAGQVRELLDGRRTA